MQIKCANRKCVCVVITSHSYCSQWCEEHAKDELLPCGCGHAICNEIYGSPAGRQGAPGEQLPRKRGLARLFGSRS